MRLHIVAVAMSMMLVGCVGSPSHQDRAMFHSSGAYDAAVAAGAEVLAAGERPGVPDDSVSHLDFTASDLDEQWGAGRYALQQIHWWGPAGPPAPEDGGVEAVGLPTHWQGFTLGSDEVRATLGPVAVAEARSWYDELLRSVTDLGEEARGAAVNDLFASCQLGFCQAPALDNVTAASTWGNLGGLAAATHRNVGPSGGYLEIGSWWFQFSWHQAALGPPLPVDTIVRVGANDVVEFIWQGDQTHSDDVSYDKLLEATAAIGLQAPARHAVSWHHETTDSL